MQLGCPIQSSVTLQRRQADPLCVVMGYQVIAPVRLSKRQRWGEQTQKDREHQTHHHSDSMKGTAFPDSTNAPFRHD
jgi:hypothetical protein